MPTRGWNHDERRNDEWIGEEEKEKKKKKERKKRRKQRKKQQRDPPRLQRDIQEARSWLFATSGLPVYRNLNQSAINWQAVQALAGWREGTDHQLDWVVVDPSFPISWR